MAEFKIAFDRTMLAEGRFKYSNRASDRGGETYSGISWGAHPNWPGWALINARKPSPDFPNNLKGYAALEALVEPLYKTEYWDQIHGDQIHDQGIANETFDQAVNSYWLTAGMFLQRALNILNKRSRIYPDLQVDGKIGPRTLAILNTHPNPAAVLKALNGYQFCNYRDLAEHDAVQEDNFYGWLSRT